MISKKIIRLKASAGSGKTYALSIRYLQLVKELLCDPRRYGERHASHVCQKLPSLSTQPNKLSTILAITFTNKAAAEMKERILSLLKKAALSGESLPGLPLSPKEAKTILFQLIEDFSDFNVMTIDAFMNTILRAFAVEAERLPDYELTFYPQKLYSLTLDRFMEQEEDATLPFQDFLDHLLTTEQKAGFNPEVMIRKALFDLRQKRAQLDFGEDTLPYPIPNEKEWEILRSKLSDFYSHLEEMQRKTKCFDSRSVKPSKHLSDLERKTFPNWFVKRHSLRSLLKKGKDCPHLAVLETRLQELREETERFFTRLEVYKLQRALKVFRLTLSEESRLYQEFNLFDGSRLPEKIQDLFGETPEVSVAGAFCRLGERYFHYLIDEYQDTSRSQWKAMLPLIENSLSEGGTLFFVGDPKQAIYGWRGGDYRLMDEAFQIMPSTWNGERHSEELDTNWRSSPTLVTFFNTLFDPEGFEEALPPQAKERNYLPDLKDVYLNNRQKIKMEKTGGYVKARFFSKPSQEEELLGTLREAFFEALHEIRQSYFDHEILILARKNDEIEAIAGWLFEFPAPIPFVTDQSLRLFTLPPIKSLLNLLSFLSFPHREFYLFALVHDGLFGTIPQPVREEIFSAYDPEKGSFEDYFYADYPLYAASLEIVREEAKRLSAYELLHRIIDHFQIPEAYPESDLLLDRLLEEVLLQEEKGVTHLREMVSNFYENTEDTYLTLPESPKAIRLMSIHKAKGLESPAVIVPFLNWTMIPNNYGEIAKLESGEYVRLTKFLCSINPQAEQKKYELDRKSFIESFNLFYVALTRAEESLYLLVPPRNKGIGIGDVFRRLVIFHRYLPEEKDSFQIGQPRAEKKGKEEKDETEPLKPTFFTTRDIRHHLRLPPESPSEKWLDEKARRTGNIVHAALSYLHRLEPDTLLTEAAKSALEKATQSMGLRLDETMNRSLVALIVRTLEQLDKYFRNIDDAWTEKEFVSKKGEIIRIDRLIRRKETFHLLEFKTGQKDPSHIYQVRNYLHILRTLEIAPIGRGVLYYLESGELQYV